MCFVWLQGGIGDEEDVDGGEAKAMQFAKMDVPEEYMADNDEELLAKLEQVSLTKNAEERERKPIDLRRTAKSCCSSDVY